MPTNRLGIFLYPGDYRFDRKSARLRTLLGSCVAIALWHPRLRIGGMCHFLLPGRVRTSSMPLDGNYADEALSLLVEQMAAAGTFPREYEARLYGGGNMFPEMDGCDKNSIGYKNAEAAKQLVNNYEIRIKAESLGGNGRRMVDFDVARGTVTVQHNRLSSEPAQCRRCGNRALCHGGVSRSDAVGRGSSISFVGD